MACPSEHYSGGQTGPMTWTNWSERFRGAVNTFWEPDSLADLVNIVRRASTEGHRLHVLGSGWSMENIAHSTDWMISLRRLNRALSGVTDGALNARWAVNQVAGEDMLFHVEAGATVADVNDLLAARGLSMPTLGGANGQAIAGAISTGTHGGDVDLPPLADAVMAMHLVTEGGRELWIERVSQPITADVSLGMVLARSCPDTEIVRNDDVFNALLVGFGRFGIIYSYVLHVRPAFYLGRGLWRTGDGTLIDGIGPDGVSAAVLNLARRAAAVQTGYLYHYAFAMIIGILGILKAGGAYVPIDPRYPKEHITHVIEDAMLQHVLTQEKFQALIPAQMNRFLLDAQWDEISDQELDSLESIVFPENLAYVIYTSGSTGQPKAAAVMHRGLSNTVQWYVEDVGLTRGDALLLLTSVSFDLTQKNIFGPLATGATLHLADDPFDASLILPQLKRERITQINLTPSALHALIDADSENRLGDLRRIVLGGEPIQVSQLLRIPEPRPEFVNGYGPTECSGVVAFHKLSRRLSGDAGASVPLGRPIRGNTIYVLDAHGEPTPTGVPGEVHIGGVGVGRGYLNRPELTNERFVPDLFVSVPGATMYKTGDLGRWRADGTLEFLGRNDFHVKVRGFRIELGEVESHLAACPGVRDVMTTPV